MKKVKQIILTFLLLACPIQIAFISFSYADSPFDPTPETPNQTMLWAFDDGEILSWITRMYRNNTLEVIDPSYYNISDFAYGVFSTTGNLYYAVDLNTMYWDVALNQLVESGSSSNHFSLINFTTGEFLVQEKPSGPEFNLFIPTNGTDGLILEWAAQALANYYYYNASMFFMAPLWSVQGNKIHIYDNSGFSQTYVDLIYYNNGTLFSGEIFQDFSIIGYGSITYNYTRNYDFNPLDDLTWGVNVGDDLYTGNFVQEIKYHIKSITSMNLGDNTLQEVKADTYWWNSTSKNWDYKYEETIGFANEYYPTYSPSFFPLVVPEGTNGNDLYRINSFYKYIYPELQYSYGDYWFEMINSTSGGYGYYEYSSTGILKLLITNDLFIAPIDYLVYYKNATTFLGFHGISIEPHDTDNFFITGEIDVSSQSLLLYAAMSLNPTNVSLDDAYLFIDLFLNDTTKLVGNVNLTISFDPGIYSSITVWWLNETANAGLGAWEQMPSTIISPGNVWVSVEHLSFFAVTGSVQPGAFTLNSTAENPDTDGNFTLTWTGSLAADSYSVYVHDSPITDSNLNDATLLISGLVNLQYPISGLNNGTYYYAVLAINEHGQILSNSITVVVQIPPTNGEPTEPPPEIPFGNYFIIFLIVGIAIILLRKPKYQIN